VKSKANTILTVGSLAFDSIETPAGKVDQVLGGSTNYFSIAASFYAPVSIVGIVGRDFPLKHLDWLASRGIDVTGIEITEGQTFHWVGSYDKNLNEAKTLSTQLNVFEHFDPKLSDAHKKAEIVFLANIDPVLQTSVLDQMNDPQLVACDSMNFWIMGKPAELKQTLRRVDILSINEGEAYLLSGKNNLLEAVSLIRELGPKTIIIKRGEYGAMLFTDAGIFIAPAFPVSRVIDPTGAGDTFAGGMMGYLSEAGVTRKMMKDNPAEWSRIMRRAVLAGCTMASFTVEDFSVHRLMRLETPELVTRGNQLMKMISIET
jgi:sugar/nucleoside kinase (ribokinase family)